MFFLSKILFLNENVPIFKKNALRLVRPYSGTISFQTGTGLQKSTTRVLSCCKSKAIFKTQNKFSNDFRFRSDLGLV